MARPLTQSLLGADSGLGLTQNHHSYLSLSSQEAMLTDNFLPQNDKICVAYRGLVILIRIYLFFTLEGMSRYGL